MKTNWNYSDLAKHYLNRPDYSTVALTKLFNQINKNNFKLKVADVGAGVAHLTIPLLEKGYEVDAVEPNDEMRKLGIERTQKYKGVKWFEGIGEATGLANNSYDLVSFGSSFNVTDREKALVESSRILKAGGWFACMWNHRNLDDPLQQDVENIIKETIQGYDYGTRRADQRDVIEKSDLFDIVHYEEGDIVHEVLKEYWLDAWRSHATLNRQAGDDFNLIIEKIETYLSKLEKNSIKITYTTRIWFCQKPA